MQGCLKSFRGDTIRGLAPEEVRQVTDLPSSLLDSISQTLPLLTLLGWDVRVHSLDDRVQEHARNSDGRARDADWSHGRLQEILKSQHI